MKAISRPAWSEVSVRSSLARAEALRLVGLPDEGPHDPDAGDLLAQHPVHDVDAVLHVPELRHHPGHDEADGDDEHRDADQQQRRQADVLAEGQDRRRRRMVIGAASSRVQVISTSIWTCCTSLVMRVISDGAPKWSTSRLEKPVTWWNRLRRTSRPKPMAARAPK